MKGQYFSFDAIIASVIFVLALVALLSYWHSVRSFLDFQNDALSKDAVRVSNLIFTPPSPSSNCADIERLGFAFDWDDRRVDESLLICAENMDQKDLRDTLGTSNALYIEVKNLANDNLRKIGGEKVPSNATDVVKIRRLATVVDSAGDTYLASIDMSVYK
jgi:hypothetical protein